MNMKTILCLPMTALLLATALVAPSAAAPLVPFSGVIEGTEDFAFQPGDPSGIDLKIHGSGGGNSTHLGLGKFTAIWDGDISFANPDSPIMCEPAASRPATLSKVSRGRSGLKSVSVREDFTPLVSRDF